MKHYTEEQKRAIFYPIEEKCDKTKNSRRPKFLLLEAGAGAGKTFVLSERVLWLLTKAPTPLRSFAHEVALLTFSKAADKEIQERVVKVLEKSNEFSGNRADMLMGTIDSFFQTLLEPYYITWWQTQKKTLQFGHLFHESPPNLSLLEEKDALDQIDINLTEFLFNQSNAETLSTLNLSNLCDFMLTGSFETKSMPNLKQNQGEISGTRKSLLKSLLEEPFVLPYKEITLATPRFHIICPELLCNLRLLAQNSFLERLLRGTLTYQDRALFLYAIMCVPSLKKQGDIFDITIKSTDFTGKQYKEIIVDEYQDTNSIQHQILMKFAEEQGSRYMVIGDPKQSIYAFRGAQVNVLNQIKADIENWVTIPLTTNFRSCHKLLDGINLVTKTLFSQNLNGFSSSFLDSNLGIEALNNRTSHSEMAPGRFETHYGETPISLVTFSVDQNRRKNKNNPGNISLTQMGLLALEKKIFELLNKLSIKPEDIVILVEKNNQAHLIADFLNTRNYPIQALISDSISQDINQRDPANWTGYLVLLFLKKGISKESFCEVLCSPLIQADLKSIESFFTWWSNIKDPNHNKNWISLGSLTEKIPQYQTESNSFQILIKLLCEKLREQFFEYSLARRFLEFGLVCCKHAPDKEACLQFFESMSSWYAVLSEIPSEPLDELSWKSHSLWKQLEAQKSPSTKLNLKTQNISVRTIHSAKGLEWPVVIYWPSLEKSENIPFFRFSDTKNTCYLKWLPDDKNHLSLIPLMENSSSAEIFSENIPLENTKGNKNKSKTKETTVKDPPKQIYYVDCAHTLKQIFEAQRLAYVAITRAQFHFILFAPFPHHSSKKGIRDELALTTVEGIANEQKFAKYLVSKLISDFFPFLISTKNSPWENTGAATKLISSNGLFSYEDFALDLLETL